MGAKFAALDVVMQVNNKLPGHDIGKLTGVDKLSTFGGIDGGKLVGLDKHTDIFRKIAQETYIRPDFEIPDFSDMRDARATRAAEQTAAHLEVLVDVALQTDARENEMLRLSKRNTTLAAIAAVASIVSVIVAIVLALILG